MTDEADAIRRAAETPVNATAAEIDLAALDLSAAFADYPIFDWFLRTDTRRGPARDDLFKLMTREIGFSSGVVQRPATGGAAAVWIQSENLGPEPLWKELQSLPTMLRASGLARFGRLVALRGAMDKHHPMDRPHAYLWLLGVHPRAQGMGVGSRLLSAGLKAVDAQGRAAFLETSTEANVALYQRHGFVVTEEYYIQPGSPPTWTMWREPQT